MINTPEFRIAKIVAIVLVCVGAINWLTYANISEGNLVHNLLKNKDGSVSTAEKIVYDLVGIAGIFLLVVTVMHFTKYGLNYNLCSALPAGGDLKCYKLLE